MTRPNFFLVGAAKSGTSAMANFVAQHPQIFMSAVKEPYFLSEVPECTLEEYLGLFKEGRNFAIRGEATTGYLFDKSSPRKINEFAPNAKIAMILRNPVDMAFSFWQYLKINGSEYLDFFEALETRAVGLRRDEATRLTGRPENYLYVSRARYADQVQRYLDRFPREQLHIILYDEFNSAQSETLAGLFSFLEVDSTFEPTMKRVNVTGERRSRLLQNLTQRRYPMLKSLLPLKARKRVREVIKRINSTRTTSWQLSDAERAKVWVYFEDDVARLETITGLDGLSNRWIPRAVNHAPRT